MKWLAWGVAGVVGLVVVMACVLWVLGRRADAGRVQASIDVDRPPAEVWAWITDPKKEKAWVSWLVEVREDGPAKVGSRQVWVMEDRNNGNERVEIASVATSVEPGRRLGVRLSAPGMFTGDAVYTLSDLGNGRTRLATDSRYRYDMAFARLMEPLITPSAKKKFVEDLARLKTLAEAAPPEGAAAQASGTR
jgi:uncharacterized protein YndB with AHSA1/START domain